MRARKSLIVGFAVILAAASGAVPASAQETNKKCTPPVIHGKSLETTPHNVLSKILIKAGLGSAKVTSTYRKVESQVDEMIKDANNYGFKALYKRYCWVGDTAIDVCKAGQAKGFEDLDGYNDVIGGKKSKPKPKPKPKAPPPEPSQPRSFFEGAGYRCYNYPGSYGGTKTGVWKTDCSELADARAAGKDDANCTASRDDMVAMVKKNLKKNRAQHPSVHCLRHVSSKYYTFDVSPKSIKDHAAFVKAVNGYVPASAIARFFYPGDGKGKERAFHLEIPKSHVDTKAPCTEPPPPPPPARIGLSGSWTVDSKTILSCGSFATDKGTLTIRGGQNGYYQGTYQGSAIAFNSPACRRIGTFPCTVHFFTVRASLREFGSQVRIRLGSDGTQCTRRQQRNYLKQSDDSMYMRRIVPQVGMVVLSRISRPSATSATAIETLESQPATARDDTYSGDTFHGFERIGGGSRKVAPRRSPPAPAPGGGAKKRCSANDILRGAPGC